MRAMSPTRLRAFLVVVLAAMFGAALFATPAYAESYASAISASSTSVPVGTSVQLTATNDSSGFAAVTICSGGWAGAPIAENSHVAPGGSIYHSVSESSPTSIQFASFAGPSGPTCTSSADSSTTVTWYQTSTTTTTVPATTTTTAPDYAVRASATNTHPAIDTEDTISGKNTSNGYEHITLCITGSNTPIAEGVHGPNTSLIDNHVTSSTAGSTTYRLYAGPSYGCSGPAEQNVAVDWANAPTLTAKPTNAGTTEYDFPNTTKLTWDDAQPGAAIKVIETSDNGAPDNATVATDPASSYSGTVSYSAKEAVPPRSGEQWVNDYQARLVSSAGVIEARADFSFTWDASSCIGQTVDLGAGSGGLTDTVQAHTCLAKGVNTIQVYWSKTKPSGLIQPSLAPLVAEKTIGTGPGMTGPAHTYTFTLPSQHSTGYFEAYQVADVDGAETIIACSGVVHLSVPPTNHYALSWTATSYAAKVGANVTLTGTNTTNAGGAAGNPEDIDYCGTSGSSLVAEGTHDPGTSLSTTVTSSTAGNKTYIAFASAKPGCSGVEARLTIDWQAKAPPPTPALELIPSNTTPTVGQSISFSLVNTSSLDPEWLNYCGVSGSTLVAAGTRDAGAAMTSPSVSSASAGDVTYHAWAATTTDGEGCHGVEVSADVDWQAAPAPTTTTTTAPPSTTTVPATTTTTVPPSTTTKPTTTTTVPPGTTTTTAPQYYPTAVYWGTGSSGPPILDAVRWRWRSPGASRRPHRERTSQRRPQ